jgi:t-SNARE complex subunit (syntaxin)
MSDFIKEPFRSDNWDPSKGDFISESAIKEDKQYLKKVKRKRIYVSFLAIIHIILIIIVLFVTKS